MSQWRETAIAGLTIGTTFTFSRTFTEAETIAFGDLTRDYNPVHYDERFSEARGFQANICHGLLVASMVCEMGGQVGWLASGMDFRFVKPIYFGDTVTCTITVTEIDERGKTRAEAEFHNQDGVLVLTGTLYGYPPQEPQKAVLRRMLAEGDTTNKLAKTR